MTKRMLIDATHAEETRVVVLDGNRLEDFDVETSTKRQLKGNIYLAKVVRVEPSLQAAFVEYGGNRHGFLAFGEIHPDYYQIPVADRQRLIDMQAEDARREEEEEDRAAEAADAGAHQPAEEAAPHAVEAEPAGSDEQPDDPADHIAAQPAAIDHETVAAPLEALATAEPDAAAEHHPDMIVEALVTMAVHAGKKDRRPEVLFNAAIRAFERAHYVASEQAKKDRADKRAKRLGLTDTET